MPDDSPRPYVFPDTPKGREDPRKRPYASMNQKKSKDSKIHKAHWEAKYPGEAPDETDPSDTE